MYHILLDTSSGFSEVIRVAMTCPFGLGRFLGLQKEHIMPTVKLYTTLSYAYRDLRAKKHRDKNSLLVLEKPADWSNDFFH